MDININDVESFEDNESIKERAKTFLFAVMDYYDGTNSDKLDRAEEFIEDMLFQSKTKQNDLFSNDHRDAYQVAFFSKYVIIPMVRQRIRSKEDSNPFIINTWN